MPKVPSDSQDEHRPLRTAIYARVSTPKQASIPQQVELCRKRCEASGHIVRYIVKEEGFSAKNIDRPKLQQLLQLCQERRIDLIVVWKLDRLVRSLRDLLNTHNYLQACSVGLMSVTEQFDTTSSFGRFSFRNIASAAELERELIGERARMGKLHQASRGRWPTQRPPLGYVLTPERDLAVDSTEASHVKRIFKWYAGGVPLTEITRRLAEKAVVTRQGRTLAPGAVHAILHNKLYAGTWSVVGLERDRPDLRIVNQATWSAVQARRGQRRKDQGAAGRRLAAIDAVFEDYLAGLREMDIIGSAIKV